MSHLTHDTCWALAKQELTTEETAAAQAHLAGCSTCTSELAAVRSALLVLGTLPPAPKMPERMAQRVGARLAQEVEASAPRRLDFDRGERRFDWRMLFAGGLAFAAAVVATILLNRPAPTPKPTEPQQPAPIAVVAPTVTPAPVVMQPPVAPVAPAPKLVAHVTTARKASLGATAIAAKQTLEEGATVSTAKGGSMWLTLPDGTRAGLTGATNVQLETMEAHALTLQVSAGSLAMVVPHDEARVVTVRAGDVSVRDLGTRFVVSRSVERVLVAVEEGSVEVTTPQGARTLHAGQGVQWSGGKLSELAWEPLAAPTQATTDALPSAAAKLGDTEPAPEVVAVPVASPPKPSAPDEEWTQIQSSTPAYVPAAPPPTAPAPPKAKGPVPFLEALEEQVRQATRTLVPPPPGMTQRQAHANDIAHLADANRCEAVLVEATAFFNEAPAFSRVEETAARKLVLLQKSRCLSKLGRDAEAAEAKRALEQLK